MKTCIIEQSCGLGDILLSIKIGCYYASQDYRVVWPVEPIYKNLRQNVITPQNIEFPCVHETYDIKMKYETLLRTKLSNVTEVDNVLYVPLRKGIYSDFGKEMVKTYGSDECNMRRPLQ